MVGDIQPVAAASRSVPEGRGAVRPSNMPCPDRDRAPLCRAGGLCAPERLGGLRPGAQGTRAAALPARRTAPGSPCCRPEPEPEPEAPLRSRPQACRGGGGRSGERRRQRRRCTQPSGTTWRPSCTGVCFPSQPACFCLTRNRQTMGPACEINLAVLNS